MENRKTCYTPMKRRCSEVRNLATPKSVRDSKILYGVINFLLFFLPELHKHLIPINGVQKRTENLNGLVYVRKFLTRLRKC